MLEKIKLTAAHLAKITNYQPKFGLILGTGLGGLVKEIETNLLEDAYSKKEIRIF